MKLELRHYQKEAIDLALKSFTDGLHKININMISGTGETTMALSLAERFINKYKDSKVLYLCRFRANVEHIKHGLIEQNPKLSISTNIKTYKEANFLITTYQNLLSVVVCFIAFSSMAYTVL